MMRFRDFLTKSGIRASEFIQEPHPPEVLLQDGKDDSNDGEIRTILKRMGGSKSKPNFLFVVLPFENKQIYDCVKTVADTDVGISTVCVTVQILMRGAGEGQVFGNLSMKVNLKTGGTNQLLDPAKLGIVSEGKTMVVGIDVTHPSPGSAESAPSVAAIVASIDKTLAQWPSEFTIQESGKEMVTGMEPMFISRLRMWEKHVPRLPENIILYRDGVSEGQYEQVLAQELPSMRNACRQVYPAEATKLGFPRFTIIICGKRHNVRFYPTQEAEADRSSNCFPGTVVDRGVTEVRNWDFFLQPHACLQGTARTCHYFVILDEIFTKQPLKGHKNAADALEDLTHNMCHLFGRATKAVSLCPPAFYADLLCTRTRSYLSDQFDPTDSSTTQSTASGATGRPAATFNLRIPDNIKDTMYYI